MTKEVVYRLLEVYGVKNITAYLGYNNYAILRSFVKVTKPDNVFKRRLLVIRNVAKMLNVPTRFIVRILMLEGVQEIWN